MTDDEREAKTIADAIWIIKNPQFQEKPATILEFLGSDYLNIEAGVRPGIKNALLEVFGHEVQTRKIAVYQKAMLTGAIGIGKSTFAAIALPYMVHWVLCLRDPQEFFNLLPGSRIAFMMMSTSETQAREVIFGDVFARIRHSKWFKENYPHDPAYKKQIKFPKDINILPGDSKETTFEGYNILGGILDEMDSHTVTADKDYADVGYDTIENRVTSRFGKRGLIIPIGQMKKSTGFAARKYAQFLTDPDAYVVRMAIWESLGWDWKGEDWENPDYPFLMPDGSRNSFYYDYKRRTFISKAAGDLLPWSETIIEIPEFYRKNFENMPEKSLKDLAGIPPAVSDPFISLVDKIELCYERWIDEEWPDELGKDRQDLSLYSPVSISCTNPIFAPWFTNRLRQDNRRRAIHIDNAYSPNGDCLGFAMGHICGITDSEDGESQPIIKFDLLMRIKAAAGTEIMQSDIRRIIYHLRDELGFRINKVTYDGFESTDSIQQLQKRRFNAEKVSMDKTTLPYEDLRTAIYEERLLFPPYITEWTKGQTDKLVNIALKELSELQDNGRKVDHPPTGSKDVTDAMAGVTYELIGDRRYRRGVVSLDAARARRELEKTGTEASIWGPNSNPTSDIWKTGGRPPMSPEVPATFDLGIIVPTHLRPRNKPRH